MNADPSHIFVTKPCLPPIEEFIPYLREIWDSSILTNGGPFHQRFEAALGEYLGVEHVNICSSMGRWRS
jgi:dTDP-4-amino-4,6-dideoxygalactose transaminase